MVKMVNLKKRSATPPSSYPITPPSTCGPHKRVRFGTAELIDTNGFRDLRHSTISKEGESPSGFFEDPKEGSDTELFDINDYKESSSFTDNIATTLSPASTPSPVSILSKHDPFSSLALAIDAPSSTPTPTITEPFRFLDLPVSIRNRVYTHLLVIPALICVRQNHTSFSDERKAFLYTEGRACLPGIAYALPQLVVSGPKTHFSRFRHTNIAILRVNKEIFAEAKAVLYGKNDWEIVRPTNELTPPPDYSVRLFPQGCQRLVTRLSIKIRSFYDLEWLLLGGGCIDIRRFYRGLVCLTLLLELEDVGKGFGKNWAWKSGEKSAGYVQRLQDEIAKELFRKVKDKAKDTKIVPAWMNLRILFDGESYTARVVGHEVKAAEQVKREELTQGMMESWELFRKGGK
ncbi:hypothetical protein L13192_09079 [Pyrenophora tritici-repentis]|uniref:Uncharacterized protein n=2 Tax=Pyrenophora tritici-repentis TaxID=45151 RepID=A0A922T0G8_9PLEO|nr:uncharacterized protein PTRG_05622 [Pyrenophora tritici-repentis Pt-1C-BFP]EDU48542.1 predicted protein [Pyrenophora tritici-repentis Pt-1C-BFP]KAI1514272.1 hypothetical protein Ptr86124_006902 [Pyrenophora tritici-repentis]KAI1666835.1 hypothetical protein L13192_09079 [Pyrenophora tritici-repentis]KAI1682674.1 hypothetical protein KJE20_07406 [Pyrenophora tritici-repentis]